MLIHPGHFVGEGLKDFVSHLRILGVEPKNSFTAVRIEALFHSHNFSLSQKWTCFLPSNFEIFLVFQRTTSSLARLGMLTRWDNLPHLARGTLAPLCVTSGKGYDPSKTR